MADDDEQLADGRRWSRRDVLRLAVLSAGAVGLSACTGGRGAAPGPGSNPSSGSIGGSGSPLALPPELRSRGGALAVTLVAAASQVPWSGGTRYALTYNGTTPGPTLRVRPGDRLTVTLENQLDHPTNLHTHGLHVSPGGDSDNVFVTIPPGGRHTYTYDLPAGHPSGTYWYHPHHHGMVAEQIFGGLAGVIVVEDAVDDALASTTERVLVLADPRIGPDRSILPVSAAEQQLGRQGDVVVVNGQLRPDLAVAAGAVERFRLVNASPSRYYRVTVDGVPMHLLASDQGRLERPQPVSDLLLTPGQRAELAVGFDRPGSYVLRSAAVTRTSMDGGMGGGGMGGGMGSGRGAGSASAAGDPVDLLTITVGTGGGATSLPAAIPAQLRPAGPALGPVDRQRTITLGAMGMGASAFVIDGRGFDPNRTDLTAALGSLEEWTIRNASMMDHPFHLHVWPFRVTQRSDGPPDPGWRDTVNVPAGGTVTILVPIRDFGGRTVYHCHILDHEDLGMMGVIAVS